MTRPGIEGGPNVTGGRRRTALPTEPPALLNGVIAILILASVLMALYLRSLNPEERVEFLRNSRAKTQAAIRSARGLAMVAINAITNGDLQRARAVLVDLQQVIATPNDSDQRARRSGSPRDLDDRARGEGT